MSPTTPKPDVLDEPSTAILSQHLSQEATALTGLLHSVREVRSVLLQNNAELLAQCLDRQAAALGASETARAGRRNLTAFTSEAAAPLSCSALVQRAQLAERAELQRQCVRLQRLAGEVDRINQANHLFIRHALGLMEQLLIDFTGGEPAGREYSRAGAPGATVYGRLMQARG